MKSKNLWVPYLVVAGAVTVGTMTLTTVAQAASHRSIAVPFTIRLEDQFLANLRYLPVSFKPTIRTTTTPTTTTTTSIVGSTTSTTTSTTPTTTTSTTTTTLPKPKQTDPTKLLKGTFVWRFRSLPAAFRSHWTVGTDNVILQGALMRFQSVHGFAVNGQMTGPVWRALTQAVLKKQLDPMSYNMVYVTQSLPQKMKLYQNGRVVLSSLVNTGISVAPTQNGTFPVYLRYTTTTMSGTLPNGSTYHDTGIPWVSYFNGGDALHGFIRSGYGYPQSLGCVEMPYANAASLWPHTPVGTLVTVQ
jgi:lipoprotein-anchoring transpeptidase ErfK/SrfK